MYFILFYVGDILNFNLYIIISVGDVNGEVCFYEVLFILFL